jgi:hypothetical protein
VKIKVNNRPILLVTDGNIFEAANRNDRNIFASKCLYFTRSNASKHFRAIRKQRETSECETNRQERGKTRHRMFVAMIVWFKSLFQCENFSNIRFFKFFDDL